MPIYKVQGPDSKIYKFEGPEGATPEQVEAFATQHFAQLAPTPQPSAASPTFWESVRAGAAGLSGAGAALNAGWNELTGDSEEQALATQEFQKQKEKAGQLLVNATDWRDILKADSIPEGAGKFLDYAKEQIGLNSPQMAAIMAGGVAGATIAPNLPHPVAELVAKVGGFGVGATLAALPIFTGFNVSRQLDEGQEPNLPKAAVLAVPQAAVEAVLGGVLAKTGLTAVGEKVFENVAPGVAKNVMGKVSEAIAVGVPGEVLQQALERSAANLEVNPFTSEEAANEYLDSAIAAAVQGGGFGSASGLYSGLSGIPKGLPEKAKKGLEEVIREDVLKEQAPKSSIIDTPEAADAVLRNNGFSPDAFKAEEKIKAANVMLDRVENNRLGYQSLFSGVAKENLQAHMQMNLKNSSGLTPTAPLRVKIQNKTPIGDVDLNKVQTDAATKSLAEIIAPQSPFIAKPVKPFKVEIQSLPLESTGEALAVTAQAQVKQRQNKYTPAQAPNEPSISELPGFIAEDMKVQNKKFKDLLTYTKPQLIEIARSKGVPESEISDTKSNVTRTKEDIAGAIMRKSYTEPVPLVKADTPVQPKTPVAPEVEINNNASKLKVKADKRKSQQAVQMQVQETIRSLNRIKADNVSFNVPETLDQNGNPVAPVETVQEANLMSAALNFNDPSNFINLETPLLEAWNYLADKGSFDAEAVDQSIPLVVKASGDLKNTLKAWAKTPEGRREIIANKFAEYAEAKRKGVKLPYVPKKLKREFNKALKTLKDVQRKMKLQGLQSLEDLFDTADQSAKQAAADGVKAIREARLQKFSDQLQEGHWKDQDDAFEQFAKDRFDEEKASNKDLGLYQRFLSSFAHLASVNPVAGVVFAIKRTQEDMQSNLMTKYREMGERYFSEREAQVRVKAGSVIDHLRMTGQNFSYDQDGSLVFERDGQIVAIKDKRMLGVIQDLDRYLKEPLNDAEMMSRAALEKLIPGAIKMSPQAIQKEAFKMLDNDQMSAKDRDFIQDQVQNLEDIERMRSKAFVPHMRFGTYGFTVHLKDNITKSGKVKPDAKPVYHAQVEEGKHFGRYNRQQYEAVQKALKDYRDNNDYVVYDGFEMTYANVYDKIGESQLTFELLSGLLGSAKDEKAYQQIKEQLERDVKFKGFARRFAPSENIPGYSQDWDRVLSSYATSSAHYFAKQKYAPMMQEYNNRIQNELGDNHKNIKEKIQKYVDYTSSPFDSFQEIRALNFVWTMGGNLSSAALQIMTLPTTTLGSMTQYNPNPIKNMRYISNNFKVAMSAMTNKNAYQLENGSLVFRVDEQKFLDDLRDKHKYTSKQIEFNKRMFKAGRTGAAFLEEQTGTYRYDTTEKASFKDKTIGGKAKTKLNEVTNYLGIPISAMEQATRFATANAHYQMFQENPQALQKAANVLAQDYRFQAQRKISGLPLIDDVVLFGLDEAHAVFGKTGRSDVLRGGLGAFVFPFQTYPQQALEFLARMYGRGPEGKKALATTVASLFLFAGLMGLPGADLFKELAEEAYAGIEGEDVDLNQLMQETLAEATGGPVAGRFVTNGIFRSLTNIDVSKRIGLPLIGQDVILAAMGVQGDMTELAGVQGSMLTQGIQAWKAYNTDESTAKIGTMITPMAISNLLKAYTYYDEGAVTGKGKQLVTPEDLRAEPDQIALRAMGIGSGTVANARDERYWATLENGRYKPAMDKFRARAKNYRTRELRAYQEGNPEEAKKWAQKYSDVVSDLQEFLTKKNVPYDIGSFFSSVNEAVAQRLAGGVQYGELNKAAKATGRYEALKKTTGN